MRILKQLIPFTAGILVATSVTLVSAGGFPPIHIGASVSLQGNVLTIDGATRHLDGNVHVSQIKTFEITAKGFDEFFVLPTHWSTTGTPPATQSSTTTTQPGQGCPPATSQTYSSPTTFTVSGPAIVQPWWNNGVPSWGQAQVRLELQAGQTVTLNQAMGVSYTYENTSACVASLDQQFGNSSFQNDRR